MRIDPTTYELHTYPLTSQGFGDNKVYCLYEDKQGTIWAGTLGSGLFYYDPATQQFVCLCDKANPSAIPPTSYVSAVLEDADGVLWVGTMYGLYALRQSGDGTLQYTLYMPDNTPGSLSSNGVQTLYEDKRRNLWIGTVDNGLNVRRKGSDLFEVYRKEDGIASRSIRGILADAAGNIWVNSNGGLSRFDPERASFTNYTREDGLASNNLYQNACLRSRTGELFFGSNDGFNAFFADSTPRNTEQPVVYLSGLRINNQSAGIGTEGSPLQ
ncbi:MAG: hypothetical protein OHK0039_23580 [Bacteroidia bacterium]